MKEKQQKENSKVVEVGELKGKPKFIAVDEMDFDVYDEDFFNVDYDDVG